MLFYLKPPLANDRTAILPVGNLLGVSWKALTKKLSVLQYVQVRGESCSYLYKTWLSIKNSSAMLGSDLKLKRIQHFNKMAGRGILPPPKARQEGE